jgi:putative two-component system response regulator
MKIVVIDDSQTTVAVLGALCAKACDCQTVTFTESRSAVEYLGGTRADLILVDYSMPGITGTDVIKRARATTLNKSTPVVMITSSREDLVRRRALEVGAVAVLNKPVNAKALNKVIRDALLMQGFLGETFNSTSKVYTHESL